MGSSQRDSNVSSLDGFLRRERHIGGSKLARRIPSGREFTFTGYDIMADVGEEQKSQDDYGDDPGKRPLLDRYFQACRLYKTTPISKVSRMILTPELKINSNNLSTLAMRAISVALVGNHMVTKLELADNNLGASGARRVADVLKDNTFVTELNISDNAIGPDGVSAIATVLEKNNTALRTLDISGSGLQNEDAKHVADILESCPHLRSLKVAHNKFGESGGCKIGIAIANNDTLEELDISWNHLREKSAIAIALGVKENVAIKYLDLSWNGLALHGGKEIGEALGVNRTLRELDLSNNRLNTDAIGHIIKGLQSNDTLKNLKLAHNIISPEVALTLLHGIEKNPDTVLEELDLGDTVVEPKFLTALEEILKKRYMLVTYGVVCPAVPRGHEPTSNITSEDPTHLLYSFMDRENYRVIDLFKRFDKDGSMAVDKDEFIVGMIDVAAPLTVHQLEVLVNKLDADGDGEVDIGEFQMGYRKYKNWKKKMEKRAG